MFKFNRIKIVFVSITAIVIFFLFYFNDAKGEENLLSKEPIFKLEINAFGIAYRVNVNGVTVLKENNVNNQVSIDLPINQWMSPDKNEFDYFLIPLEDQIPEHAYAKVTLIIEDNNDANIHYKFPLLMFNGKNLPDETEMSESLIEGQYGLADSNDIVDHGNIRLGKIIKLLQENIGLGAYKYSRQIEIPNSLPRWAFFDSDTLPDYYEVSDDEYYAARDDLFVEYKKVLNGLADNDVNSIMPMYEEHNLEGDLAFYNKPGKMESLIKKSMQANIDDPDWTLRIRKPEHLGITMEDNRKLVSLTLDQDGNSIGFVKSNGAYDSYPLMFRRQNGKWILTR